MEEIKKIKFWEHIGLAVVGMLLFATGINLFIVPASLYNGGILGISQIIRTLLVKYLHMFSGATDIAGIINLVLNVPLFVLAYMSISKSFFVRTLICVISQTVFLSFIPIPASPIVADSLTACMIGGIMTGSGIGIALRFGGSSGGMDIVGMYFTKKYKNFSVGKVSLVMNGIVYGICGIMFGLPTAIYSIIHSAVSTLMTDRAHIQNINVEVMIFTKESPEQIVNCIVNEFHRDATWWEAKGGYTEGGTYMVLTILSKYECEHLRPKLKRIDKHAFIVVKEGMHIAGKYEKHL